MIIVKLWGGMGNQMFQYAFGRSLAHRLNSELKLDLGFFSNQPKNNKHVFRNYDLSIFNIRENIATDEEVYRFSRRFKSELIERIANRIIGRKNSYVNEPHFNFSERAYFSKDNVYLSGYWQSEKYFIEVSDQIREEFTFREEMGETARLLRDEILATNAVCVNVRRGDFVTNDFHGSYGSDYFDRADSIMGSYVSDRRYYVFSDDVEWCRENLKFSCPVYFVGHQFAGPKFQDYLRLMIACKHFIIPNSSFAWWAVWLNESNDRIAIAPKKWFNDPNWDTKDLYLPEWIRI